MVARGGGFDDDAGYHATGTYRAFLLVPPTGMLDAIRAESYRA